MRVYRARAWRLRSRTFEPLDSSGSVSGPRGWRFNDLATEILYTAEVESLAILEVAIRPGLETIDQILVATIEIPDDSVWDLTDLKLTLPSNWNARPAADDSRTIAREFLDAAAKLTAKSKKPVGLRVPSVLSGSDCNILLDPARKPEYQAKITNRIPFSTLRTTGS